jgi:Ca2+/Na+ antiporter
VIAGGRPADGPDVADPEMEDVDPAALRPVPRRPGRGGFDPEAAATAKVFRYRRRRRVTVFLLLATIAFTLVSVFLAPTAWIGAVVSGVLLIGYLTYLRRQVRIEESIRQRRMARLARARQIRPDYGRDPYGRDPYGRDPYGSDPGDRDHHGSGTSLREPDRPASAADHRSARRGSAAETLVAAASVPPSPRSGTVVDLDDDDPAFAELEYHRPLTYRRASGQ